MDQHEYRIDINIVHIKHADIERYKLFYIDIIQAQMK